MKTAAAYIRVSDERQDEFSPDSQLKLIRDYCVKNEIDLPEELIFYDDGISAKSAEKRVKFNEMIALAKLKDRPFDMILVWKFSRFARNQEESIVYKSLLRKNGVEVISISEPLSDNPFGGLIERIIEWMDEYYLIRLSDEVRRGMTERATRGLPNVAPPFGYKMINGEYVIDEENAQIVRKIFEMFVEGEKIRNISVYLKELEVKNRYGNYLDNRAIEYILNNPCYIGYLRYNPNERSSSKRIFNNPKDILKKSTHDPIISDDVWKAAQEILAERQQVKSKYMRKDLTGNVYALKGLVRCNTCGSTLVYGGKTKGLQCHKYAKGICSVSHYISLDLMNKMVIEALKDSIGDLSFSINYKKKPKSLINKTEIDIDSLIHKEELRLERARNAYQEGADSLSEYREQKAKILDRIAALEKKKEEQQEKTSPEDLRVFTNTVTGVIDLLENPNVSEELKNLALKAILDKIVFYKPEKRIELFFHL